MHHWLAIVGLASLIAAAAANSQVNRSAQSVRASPAHPRTINLRLIQEPAFNRFDPPTTGLIADTQIAPHAQLGLGLITAVRPRLGPEWRMDGRSPRSRRPAVSFTFRF